MIKGQWRRNQGEVTKAVEGEEGGEEVKSSALCCRDALWIGRFADAAQSYTEDCEGFWEFRPRSWYLWVRKPDITLSCQCSQSSTQDRFEFYYYYIELLDNVLVVGCLSVGVTNFTFQSQSLFHHQYTSHIFLFSPFFLYLFSMIPLLFSCFSRCVRVLFFLNIFCDNSGMFVHTGQGFLLFLLIVCFPYSALTLVWYFTCLWIWMPSEVFLIHIIGRRTCCSDQVNNNKWAVKVMNYPCPSPPGVTRTRFYTNWRSIVDTILSDHYLKYISILFDFFNYWTSIVTTVVRQTFIGNNHR